MNPSLLPMFMVWTAAVTCGVAAVTTAIVWTLATRWATGRAEHRAEHDVVQACLWAATPMEVLAFYARYRPNPPDLAAYADDRVARDPALEQLTRRPTLKVRPSAPPEPSDPVGKEEAPPPPPAATPVIEPRPAAVSHRAMRRPVVGWWEETGRPRLAGWWARVRRVPEPLVDDETRQRIELDMEIDQARDELGKELGKQDTNLASFFLPPEPASRTDDAPPAPPVRDLREGSEHEHAPDGTADAIPADIPAASDEEIITSNDEINTSSDGLLNLAPPPLCARCKGTRRLALQPPGVTTTESLWSPCPDCCCVEPDPEALSGVCGWHTGGGLCPDHQAADDLRQEDQAKRTADV